MKKTTLLFFSISLASLAFCQVSTPSKPKDSLKKVGQILVPPEMQNDTLFDFSGKLQFFKKNAHASYYADKFHGRKTASGKLYNKNKFTAAHKKLPFGTKLKVTNQQNGKSILVEITDRGPFVRSREIDLSRRAFMHIASNKRSGSMQVTLELVKK